MSNLIRIALLYGGNSGEHEISLISAASVLANLDTNRYKVLPIGMDKEGRFFLNDYEELLHYKDFLPVKTERSLPIENLVKDGQFSLDVEVVFPMVHGPLYEDGCFQGILELANVAYVGCDVLSSSLGMDKDMARRIVGLQGIKSARYRVLSWYARPSEIAQFCQRTVAELGFPLFVKPCSMGSSVGIHKVRNMEELLRAIDDAKRYDTEVLVEECIKGREIELAVLENISPSSPPKVSLAGEIRVNHRDGFYSYTAKYLESDQTELIAPVILEEKLLQQLQQISAEIFLILKCKGMARVDFFVNDQSGEIYFNEINTLPGFTPISMYPKLWQVSGLPYPELLDKLVEIALVHHRCRQHMVTHYQ
jgi:D-alanine-D-alanine ligase